MRPKIQNGKSGQRGEISCGQADLIWILILGFETDSMFISYDVIFNIFTFSPDNRQGGPGNEVIMLFM